MKKYYFILIIISFSILFIGCNIPHEHSFVEGVCECGEVDPNYEVPHEHEFIEGKCECGEVDPNNEPPHEHKYNEGKCECGEEDPKYEPPHICVYCEGTYCHVCENVRYNHEYIDGVCKCGLKEGEKHKSLSELLIGTYKTYNLTQYFPKENGVIYLYRNYSSITFEYSTDNPLIDYLYSVMDLQYIKLEELEKENIDFYEISFFGSHYDYHFSIYLGSNNDQYIALFICDNGMIKIHSSLFDGEYVSLENIDFIELQKKCYQYDEGFLHQKKQ